jgi:hypothetical protein
MKPIFFMIDLFLLPVIFLISLIFYAVRVAGDKKLVMCNKLLLIKGILPTRTYFEESPK